MYPFGLFHVLLGVINREENPEDFFVETSIPKSSTYSHENYDSSALSDDIGLIYLKTSKIEILKNPNIGIINLPTENVVSRNLVDISATLSGFGVAKDGGKKLLIIIKAFKTCMKYAKG